MTKYFRQVFVLMLILRFVLGLVLYTWLRVSTPLHRLEVRPGVRAYVDLVQDYWLVIAWYVGVYASAGLFVAAVRSRPQESSSESDSQATRREGRILETAQMMLLVVDLVALHVLQSVTNGAMSTFRFATATLVAVLPLVLRSAIASIAVFLIGSLSYVLLYFAAAEKTPWDLLVELVPIAATFALCFTMRLSLFTALRRVK